MLKFFWGPPSNPGQMRFYTGSLLTKPKAGPRQQQRQHATHEITGLYGAQVGKSFLGRIKLGEWSVERDAWIDAPEFDENGADDAA